MDNAGKFSIAHDQQTNLTVSSRNYSVSGQQNPLAVNIIR